MNLWREVTQLSILAGLLLSIYASLLKVAAARDPDYVPTCDISEEVSCSKVMHSEYGSMLSYMGLVDEGSFFDQANSVYGAIFYVACVTVSLVPSPAANKLLFQLSVLSMTISLGLAYIMKYRIGALCIVCIGTYICNTAFMIGAWKLHNRGAKDSSFNDKGKIRS